MTGRYLVLDGPDGGGKSTQAARLCARLAAGGVAVLHLREPGSTAIGEQLRELLLRGGDVEPLTEALLFSAARAEMVHRQVGPALADGRTVVAERCFLSTMVYQGLAPLEPLRRVPVELVGRLSAAVHAAHRPDRLVVLDVPVAVTRQRLAATRPDRFEARGDAFLARVREAYLALAADPVVRGIVRAPAGVRIVDAARAPDAVERDVLAAVAEGSPDAPGETGPD